MELNEVNNNIKHLPEEQKEAILKLIDLKTNDNMEKVINAINHLEKTVDTKINTLYWVLGVVGAIITLAISVVITILSK